MHTVKASVVYGTIKLFNCIAVYGKRRHTNVGYLATADSRSNENISFQMSIKIYVHDNR